MTIPNLPKQFVHLLTNNHAPSAREHRSVKAFHDVAVKQQSRNSEELAKLYERIDKLQKDNQTLKNNIASAKSILSLARHLPLEILQEIFLHLALLTSPTLTLTYASSVCRRWRDAALSLPYLWSTIHLTEVDDYSFLSLDRLARCWIERSRDLPLELVVDEISTDMVEYMAQSLFNLENRKRWRSITFKSAPGRLLALFFEKELRTIPGEDTTWSALEILHLDLDPTCESQQKEHLVLDFIPYIKDFAILVDYPLKSIRGNLHQLTSLCLRLHPGDDHAGYSVDISPYLRTLRECVNLENCTLHVPSNADGAPDPTPAVVLDKLRKLHIHTEQVPDYIDEFLQCIEARHLQDLGLFFMDEESVPEEIELIMAYALQHRETLQKLSLFINPDLGGFEAEDFCKQLGQLRRLVEFNFYQGLVPCNSLFEWLTFGPKSPNLPNLEVLRLRCLGGERDNVQDLLLNIVESRVGPGPRDLSLAIQPARLKYIDIHVLETLWKPSSSQRAQELRMLNHGLQLHLNTSGRFLNCETFMGFKFNEDYFL